MKYIFFLIFNFIFISSMSYSEVYTGANSPGVENLVCGKYRVKGKFIQKKKQIHHLIIYPDTTRQYKMPVKGKMLQKYKDKLHNQYVVLFGEIKRKQKADQNILFVDKDYPDFLYKKESYEYSVKLIQKNECDY